MPLWIGSYGTKGGEGLYRIDDGDDAPMVTDVEPRIANASFAARAGRTATTYFTDEQDQGRVTAWRYQEGWHPLGGMPSGGAAPCYLALSPDERWLACANYGDGAVSVFRIDPDNGALLEMVSHHRPSGSGPDAERQDGPHAHCVIFDGDARLYHVDLGLDRVFRHELDEGRIVATQVAFTAPPGAGPRHLLLHPKDAHALLICELSAELLLLKRGSDGDLTCLDRVSASPGASAAKNLGGHVALDPLDQVVVTNRGHDSLVRFAIDSGKLRMLDCTPTGGTSPRHLVMRGDGAIIAHEESGDLTHVLAGSADPTHVAIIPGAAFVIDIPD